MAEIRIDMNALEKAAESFINDKEAVQEFNTFNGRPYGLDKDGFMWMLLVMLMT